MFYRIDLLQQGDIDIGEKSIGDPFLGDDDIPVRLDHLCVHPDNALRDRGDQKYCHYRDGDRGKDQKTFERVFTQGL